MIGIFKVIEISDSNKIIIGESEMNKGFKGNFYLPPLYRESCSNLSTGDRFFGVLDDDSGFGAMLYKFDDNVSGSNLLHVTNEFKADGNISTDSNISANGSITADGNISTGDHFHGKMYLSMDAIKAIAETLLTGTGDTVVTNPATITGITIEV